jgi:pimeloyl-ACP methyl ester carboxylesterase
VIEVAERSREQSRARYPDDEGFVERDGVRTFYEVYHPYGWQAGTGEPAILFLPTWSVVHSRVWKGQIAWFARRHRVIVFDGRGNGRSDRPRGTDAYRDQEFVADALAVLDATGTGRAVVVGVSRGARWALRLAAEHPDRAGALVIIGPGIAMTHTLGPKSVAASFEASGRARVAWTTARSLLRLAVRRPSALFNRTARLGARHTSPFEGARMFNRRQWQEDYRGFLEWFFGLVFLEPHSTKSIEDAVSWGLETTPEVLADTIAGDLVLDRETALDLCARVSCPSLVITGEDDIVTPPEWSAALAAALDCRYVCLPGCGHGVAGRHPVAFNLALREFVESEVRA